MKYILIILLSISINIHSQELSYSQQAILDAKKISPDTQTACKMVYHLALSDGHIKKMKGPDGKMAPVQMEISELYNSCIQYWTIREHKNEAKVMIIDVREK